MAPTHPPRPYDPGDYDASSVKLDRFMKAAQDQVGDKYRFGAEASEDDANPTSFDSSELVEWAAHQAGFHDMPDGSWNQYRYLHEQGATVPVEEALHTRGALVFGFSSDPTEGTDRPARAYVGISLGDGKSVLDVSERAGQVRVMDHGGFYSYGAKIPEFHAPDDSPPPDVDTDSVGIDTDGDGIPDSSAAPPELHPPDAVDTDGDGVPDSSAGDPVAPGAPGDPIDWGERRRRGIVPDRRTDEHGLPDMGPPVDDPVVPTAPGQGHSPSGRLYDPVGGGEPEAVASRSDGAGYADDPLAGEQSYDRSYVDDSYDQPSYDEPSYDQAGGAPAVAAADTALAPAAETTADADPAGDSYGADTYAEAYSDSYADAADASADV